MQRKVKPIAKSLDRYVAEINRYPVLSRQEELEIALRYRDQGDQLAAKRLVVSNLRFVVKIAHEYKGYQLRLLDLIQEGNIGLIKAVEKFDPDKGYRLISYAVWWIRAYIQNFIMKSWSLVKMGTTQAQRKLFFKLRAERQRADVEAGPGEVASIESVAKRLGVQAREVASMEQRLTARDFSLNAEVQDGAKQTHLDMLTPVEDVLQEDYYAVHEARSLVQAKVLEAKQQLNDKEAYIIDHRLLAEEPQTLQAIGAHFGISRERARQIEGNVIRKLRAAFAGAGLDSAAA